MGGIIIIIGIIFSTLLWADLSNVYIWTLIFVSLSFSRLGLADDILKIKYKNSRGLKSRYKFLGQLIIGAVALTILIKLDHQYLFNLYFPFLKIYFTHGFIFYSFWPFCNYWFFKCCKFNRWT